jgi:hypothetical protein
MSDLPDVNTGSGFNEALARIAADQAGVEVEEGTVFEDAPDTSIASGLTFTEEESTQPRDDSGRFTSRQPEGGEEGVAPEGEEETPETPEVVLTPEAQQLQEAQKLIGRQSEEVGLTRRENQELRERLARLEGRLESREQTPAQTAPLPVADDVTIERLENMFEQGGAQGMMSWVIQNRPELIEAAEDIWAADDPVAASRYTARRLAYEVIENERAALQRPAEPQQDEFVEGLKRERQIGATIQTVRSGMSEGEWGAIREHLVPLLQDETTPEIIKNAVVSEDQNVQLQGVNALVQIARGRAIAAATEKANVERAAQVKNTKQRAAVATGSLRPAPERKPDQAVTPEDREAAIKAFHETILRAPTTSVRDGLVFNS